MTPKDLKYTAEHEWVARKEAETVRVGITDFAQRQLGDVVYVELPQAGQRLGAGDPAGTLESVKAVSEYYAPLSGQVTAVNEELNDSPELINNDPYGEGWILELAVDDPAAIDRLLDADAYDASLDEG